MIEINPVFLGVPLIVGFVIGFILGHQSIYRGLCRDPQLVRHYLKKAEAYAAYEKAMAE